MILRAALMSLLAACLFSLPAAASQPAELAARFVTNPFVPSGPVDENGLPTPGCPATFAWIESFAAPVLDAGDTVTLDMAIIPLRSGRTEMTLIESRGYEIASLLFVDGSIRGLPYDRLAWNDVAVQLRPATQDFVITVNGATAGPFAYGDFCRQQGDCSTPTRFVFRGHAGQGGEEAWIDTVSIFRGPAPGGGTIYKVDFDRPCARVFQTTGGLLIGEPPPRARSGR